jgi:hypothetical protein
LNALVETEKSAYERDLRNASPDLDALAYGYVSGLFDRIEERLRPHAQREFLNFQAAIKSAIVMEGAALYRAAGRDVLGPLVVRFVENVLMCAPKGATVAFLARDAEPYFEAAKVLNELPQFKERELDLRYVTLNRQHFQIFDENLSREQRGNSDREQEALRDLYLKQQNFANPNGVVIVDTGCWGTMIEKLWVMMAQRGTGVLNLCQAHFMYSHNPAIFGFVNHVANAGGLRELATQGVFVGDTFECLPKREESSSRFALRGDGVVEPIRMPIESVYLASWNRAVVEGICASARSFADQQASFVTAIEALTIVEEQRRRADEEFTGVLPQATPKWSKGDEYLSTWSLPPIPPCSVTTKR